MRKKVNLPDYLVKQAKQARFLGGKPLSQVQLPYFGGLVNETLKRFERKSFLVKNRHQKNRALAASILYQRKSDNAFLYLFVQDFTSFVERKPADIQAFLRKIQTFQFSPKEFSQQGNFAIHKKIISLIKDSNLTPRNSLNIVGIGNGQVMYLSWM